ncbi:CCA tRNA nucleotidyltransferase [Thomasclavelia sp.]
MKSNYRFPPLVKNIFNDIDEKGGSVFLVGGIVRDMLVYGNVDYHDVDVEVYGLTIEQLENILSRYGNVNCIGKSFGILKLDNLFNYDFALPRTEIKVGKYHQDFKIIVDKDLDFKIAASRRDLTINALMYEIKTNKIHDYFHGIEDLNRRTLRMVDEKTFPEDPLRVLRLAQFASRLDFCIEPKTKEICKKMVKKGLLNNLSNERVFNEYNKLLLSNRPSIGLSFLKDIKAILPCLDILSQTMQRLDYHPEGNVWRHTLLVIDLAALCKHKTANPLGFMWGALLHDIGKPLVTTKEGHAPKHNEAGVKIFNQQLKSLIPDKKLQKYIKTIILYHMHLMNMVRNGAKDYSYFKILKGIDGIVSIEDLILITKCDKLGRYKDEHENINYFDFVMKKKMAQLGTVAQLPLIDGNDLKLLGIEQSSKYRELLDWAYDLQLKGHDKASILKMIKGR